MRDSDPIRPTLMRPRCAPFCGERPTWGLKSKCSQLLRHFGPICSCFSFAVPSQTIAPQTSFSCTAPILHGRESFAKNLKRGDIFVVPFGQFPPSFRLFKLCCRSCESLICGNRQRGGRDGAEIETPVTQAVHTPGIRAAPGGAGGDSVQRSRPGLGPA